MNSRMKVVQANKFYFLQGGTERYFLDTIDLLEKEKIECIPFAMKHEKNLPTPYSKYFVSNVDFSKVRFNLEGLRVIGRMLYSFEAKRKVRELIKNEKPDIAHIHNIYHQISPSILGEFKKAKIPVVATLHDYKMISPEYLLYSQYPKSMYTRDVKKYRYYKIIPRKTIKNSYAASTLAAFEMYFHKLFRFYERNVDLYIAPSQFVKDIFVEWGWDGSKIEVLHHYVNHDNYPYSFMYDSQDPYIIYWGRHSGEKGLDYLIKAMEKLPDVRLIVCGTGPDHEDLKQMAENMRLNNIEFKGFVPDDELSRLVRDAQFVVVPSVFPETFGLVITEAFAYGKPVIAPNRGAPPELIDEGETGYLFAPQDVRDLQKQIKKLWNKKDDIIRMSHNARTKAEKVFDPRIHIDQLIGYYDQLIADKK